MPWGRFDRWRPAEVFDDGGQAREVRVLFDEELNAQLGGDLLIVGLFGRSENYHEDFVPAFFTLDPAHWVIAVCARHFRINEQDTGRGQIFLGGVSEMRVQVVAISKNQYRVLDAGASKLPLHMAGIFLLRISDNDWLITVWEMRYVGHIRLGSLE